MKTVIAILFALVVINQSSAQKSTMSSQPQTNNLTQQQELSNQDNHLTSKSFFKSKDRWQDIIDSTWGPGLPLDQKLEIFDTYTLALTREFDGFVSLGINEAAWDSIITSYRTGIDSLTSRGAFCAILNRLSYDLKDGHTFAGDLVVNYAPLTPGTPLLAVGGFNTVEHFGAVLTPLEDSSILVLRTRENHPLGLQPGDIILGYENIVWKDLIDELLESNLPLLHFQSGAKSASRHNELLSAGMNWHLFDIIDIVKYSSGDTLHLSVDSLADLPDSTGTMWSRSGEKIWNNEQLPVPGVPFPDPDSIFSKALSYGIVNGTNIGYVYLYAEPFIPYDVDPQIEKAFTSLINTDGLIIDLRYNIGGGADFDAAERLLFNQDIHPLGAGKRCNADNFSICDTIDPSHIPGDPEMIYDRPIAVLIGPNSLSCGENEAHFLSYHPMVQFIGKPASGSTGDAKWIKDVPDWMLVYSVSDRFRLSDSVYLNRKEFPIDIPVWFNAEDVANGTDPVVETALEWMHNLSYAHDITIASEDIQSGTDTLAITALMENPNDHELTVMMKIKNDDNYIDSTLFYDDGIHEDSLPGDGIWGALWPLPAGEKIYTFSVTTEDKTNESSRTLPDVIRYSTLGPVKLVNYAFTGDDQNPNPGDSLGIELTLQNYGTKSTAENISVELSTSNEMIKIPNEKIYIRDILAGQTLSNNRVKPFSVQLQANGDTATAEFAGTGGWQVWTDASTSIYLDEGDQTIRIYAATGGFNINYIELSYSGIEPDANPNGTSVPVIVEAEDYADMRGVKVQACSEGGENVGWIDAGNWMDYSVNVANSGFYSVCFRVAAERSGSLSVNISEECPVNSEIDITVDIMSDGYTFWRDTFSLNILPNTVDKEIEKP